MNDSTDAIVLYQQEYKEKDALLYVLTPGKGFITFLARGLQKLDSKNSYACMPFSVSQLTYDEKENSDFQLLHSASLIESNRKIREDLVKTAVASVMSELALKLLRDGLDEETAAYLYHLIQFSLDQLRVSDQYQCALGFYLARVLDLIGIGPMVDGCTSCGNEKVNSISLNEGGFLCPECRIKLNSPVYSPDILKQFRLINKAKEENYPQLEKFGINQDEVLILMNGFLVEYAGITLKSWAFLEKCTIIK